MVRPKSAAEIETLHQGGKILATVLDVVSRSIIPGITTKQLADIARREVRQLGAEAAFLDYSGFPDVICISVNDMVVHGIPGPQVIKDGDVVSLDFGVKYRGLVTDSARSYIIGAQDEAKRHLLKGTRLSLEAGLATLKAGVQIGDIGAAIQSVLEAYKLGIVRDLIGHGVGYAVHEDPDVPNFGHPRTGLTLTSGTVIAIEPMATLGSSEVYVTADGWGVVTRDGSLSAHFEDTVVVTENGFKILTRL
jgi:methionyl aminopeptidase